MKTIAVRAHRNLLLALVSVLSCEQLTYQKSVHAELWGITSDSTGSFDRLVRFDPVTGDELSGGLPNGTPGLSRPSGIATGPDGKIYISSRGFNDETPANEDVAPGVLSVSCSSAGVCGTPTTFADFTVGADPIEPAGLKFGPDGNLYVAELFFVNGDDVRVYSPGGTRLANAVSGVFPTGIAFDSDDNLLVGTPAGGGFPATVLRFNGGMPQPPLYIDNPAEPQLAIAGAFLQLQNGDVLTVDVFGGRVVRIGPTGVLTHFAFIPESIPSAPTFPSDIVFDPDGNLIVSVLGPTNAGEPGGVQGQLLRYDLAGNLLETMLSEFEPIGGLTWTDSPLTVAGNYDGIGGVDEGDYQRLVRDFGKLVAPGNGADGNGDGVVDAADFIVWRKFFDSGPGAGGGGSVPEPATASMVLIALLASAANRGRTRMSHIL
jgi:sugar lactone lactonase YvrE